jgi:hypothetical protein
MYGGVFTESPRKRDWESVMGVLIGYARCSTDEQDLTAQRETLHGFGVPADRVYFDQASPAPTGTAPAWPKPSRQSAPATHLGGAQT